MRCIVVEHNRYMLMELQRRGRARCRNRPFDHAGRSLGLACTGGQQKAFPARQDRANPHGQRELGHRVFGVEISGIGTQSAGGEGFDMRS